MNYIEQIFDRANIQDVCEFLLHGNERMDFSSLNYKERPEEKEKQVITFLEQKYPRKADCDKIMCEIYSYITEIENVYLEVAVFVSFCAEQ